jgi:hypothetical protein
VDGATNRVSGYVYDANGDLLTTGFTWDVGNRMVSSQVGLQQYAYDGLNKRTWFGNYTSQQVPCDPPSPGCYQYQLVLSSETIFF